MWMIIDICAMDILLTAATPFEIEMTTAFLAAKQDRKGNQGFRILVSGVGGPATSYFLLDQIRKKKPAIIIQAGIAGAFSADAIGKTYVITEDRFADLGVEENDRFRTVFDLKLADGNGYPYVKGALPNPNTKLIELTDLPLAKAISVNEISTNPKRIKQLQLNSPLLVESMEGAAFHYTCLLEKIPFVQLRAISNLVGERDKKKWKLADSISALNESLISLINKLAHVDATHFRL
jgi:futalosine hydrolase